VLRNSMSRWLALFVAGALLFAPAALAGPADGKFTIAVIPDTQNYVDYTHQKAEGFPFDAREMLFEQMRYVAANLESAGGEIAFVTQVGDVWQHPTIPMDPDHKARGFKTEPNPVLEKGLAPSPKVHTVEIPAAKQAFELIAGKVPFSVVPGNHDYDAHWSAAGYKPDPVYNPNNPTTLGMIHVGGVESFKQAFGDQSPFFKGKPWHVGSFNGGANSAQVFEAGGYRFLHIGLQFAPPDDALAWAADVIRKHPGLPTIISTHDFLHTSGQRLPNPSVDMREIDKRENNPQDVWLKLICRNDQIFLVLSGHEHGQARRVDLNQAGHRVWQVLADYQDRGQTAIDAGVKGRMPGIGDGWLRLMSFDLESAMPEVRVRTYSTHYKAFSGDLPSYAAWYRHHEQPIMTDAEFLAADDFTIPLDDFRARYGAPRAAMASSAALAVPPGPFQP
jgi:hypothetical protein